jgi:50S ribosomal protein L16 3-hydroxylase
MKDDSEAELCQAKDMKSFELLQTLGLSVTEAHTFFEETFLLLPYAHRGGASPLSENFDWLLLSEILRKGHSNTWLPHDGHIDEWQEGSFEADGIFDFYKKGKTILIRHAEECHPRAAEVAGLFSAAFLFPVDVQLYYTPGGQQGFGWHYDKEDVFILQAHGSKEFFLRENTLVSNPRSAHHPEIQFCDESSSQHWSCILEAGDWLYLPAGLWHKARAVEDSIHLSVGILMPKMAGLARQLKTFARQKESNETRSLL